jgi:hypothetical protein
MLYALCSMLYALCSMLYALCSMLYALRSTLYALRSALYALRFTSPVYLSTFHNSTNVVIVLRMTEYGNAFIWKNFPFIGMA